MSSTADVRSLPLHRQITLVGGVLLFISLFFPWRSTDFFSVNGWYGVGTAVGILVVFLLVWEALRLLGTARQIKVNQDLLAVGLAALIVLFGVIQFFQSLTGGSGVNPGFGAFLNLVFILGLGYAALLAFQAAGGAAALVVSDQAAPSQPTTPESAVPAPPAPPVSSPAPETPAAPDNTAPNGGDERPPAS